MTSGGEIDGFNSGPASGEKWNSGKTDGFPKLMDSPCKSGFKSGPQT